MPKSKQPERNPVPIFIGLMFAIVGIAAFVLIARNTAPKKPGAAPQPTNSAPASSNVIAIGDITPEAATEEPDEVVARLVNEGNKALEQNRPNEALTAYRKAIETKPDDEDAHFNLGIAYARLGKTNEARASYEKAIEIFPDYPEAHNNLGNLLMREGNLPKAIEHFESAIRAMPESPSAQNNLGTAFARQGKFAEAAVRFAEAIRLQPDYLEARVNLGNTYTSLSRFEDAARELEIALQLDPSNKATQRAVQNLRAKAGR